MKAVPVVSLECGAETPISGKPKESTEALPIEDMPARHELTGLQLFSSSNACTSPEMVRLHANIFIYLFNTAFISVD